MPCSADPLFCVTNTSVLHTEAIMVAKTANRKTRTLAATHRVGKMARSASSGRFGSASIVMEEARRAGLLDGDKTEHVSFRAPKALVEAAKRESGATKPTEP